MLLLVISAINGYLFDTIAILAIKSFYIKKEMLFYFEINIIADLADVALNFEFSIKGPYSRVFVQQ